MEQKKEKGLPIFAILALVVLVAGICAAMIPSLKTYREQVRTQALYAESKAVYYAAQNVVRTARADGTIQDGSMTSDGVDEMSGKLQEELMGLIEGQYQAAVSGSQLSTVYVTDGKYYVEYDKNGVKEMNFQLPKSEEEEAE